MGFDATRDRLIDFRDALAGFVEVLRQADVENEAAVTRLAGTWDDTFSVEFGRRLAEFSGPVGNFTAHEAERYLAYLDDQIDGFGRYLDGR